MLLLRRLLLILLPPVIGTGALLGLIHVNTSSPSAVAPVDAPVTITPSPAAPKAIPSVPATPSSPSTSPATTPPPAVRIAVTEPVFEQSPAFEPLVTEEIVIVPFFQDPEAEPVAEPAVIHPSAPTTAAPAPISPDAEPDTATSAPESPAPPTSDPTVPSASASPDTEATTAPQAKPTGDPSAESTTPNPSDPAATPSVKPSTEPSEPTTSPPTEPSQEPSPEPSPEPTPEPTPEPSPEPEPEYSNQVDMTRVVPYNKQATFIAAIAPMAQATQRTYGVPASVTIAQAILESGWGGSTLSRYGQAYFGVKCSGSNYGPHATGCISLPTWEVINGANVTVQASFRSYDSLTDSILDHGYFLRNNSRYAPAFNTTDPVRFAQAIAAAGYATDPAYASKLVSIIDSNDLRQFDSGTLAGVVPVTGAIGAVYESLGGRGGPLGTAVGIESDGPVAGSRLVSFDTGVIISAPSTGAHALIGKIWHRYRLDYEVRNAIGVPIGDELNVGAASVQRFQAGTITTTQTGATLVVFGAIHTAYQNAGGHAGSLGLPTSEEEPYGAGVIQYFQGGSIVHTNATGAVVRS